MLTQPMAGIKNNNPDPNKLYTQEKAAVNVEEQGELPEENCAVEWSKGPYTKQIGVLPPFRPNNFTLRDGSIILFSLLLFFPTILFKSIYYAQYFAQNSSILLLVF